MQIDIDISRAEAALSGFRIERLAPAVRRAVLRMQARMAVYPPQRPGSTYVRTGTLGRRWTSGQPTISTSGSAIVGRYGNNTNYAPFVQGDLTQARIHRGRWQTDEQVARELATEIALAFEREIERMFR